MDHSDRNLDVMTIRTLRDEFAMAALTGMLANHTLVKAIMKEHGSKVLGDFFEDNIYEYADRMIKARDRKI
jgi:hypothetical protein